MYLHHHLVLPGMAHLCWKLERLLLGLTASSCGAPSVRHPNRRDGGLAHGMRA